MGHGTQEIESIAASNSRDEFSTSNYATDLQGDTVGYFQG